MKRETRANLIFLGLFVALALPGIYKLTKRAYRSGGRDPAMRAAVHDQFAYMDPTPPVGLPRVVPTSTADYVQSFAKRLEKMLPGLKSIAPDTGESPLMSDTLNFQVIALGPQAVDSQAPIYRVALFGWNSHFAPLPSQYAFTATRDGQTIIGQMNEYEPQNLPIDLRSELQDFGYVNPPTRVLWLVATFPGAARPDTMQVKFHIDQFESQDTIDLRAADRLPTTAPTTVPAS